MSLLRQYIHSLNIVPNDLHCAFSITANEVEAWCPQHTPGQFLAYPSLFCQRQVHTTSTHTTPTLSPTPTSPQ